MANTIPQQQPVADLVNQLKSGKFDADKAKQDLKSYQVPTLGNGANFWTEVNSGLAAAGVAHDKAHSMIRNAQGAIDPMQGAVGDASDSIAIAQSADPSIQADVDSYVKAGGNEKQFYVDLAQDLEGVNGLSVTDAESKATSLKGFLHDYAGGTKE